jgi:hypothetical protein
MLSIFTFGVFYGPNPIISGIAAIPLCIALVDLIQWKVRPFLSRVAYERISTAIFVAGIALFASQMVFPCPPRHAQAALAQQCNSYLETIARVIEDHPNRPFNIAWCLTHDGLLAPSFQIYFNETRNKQLPPEVTQWNLMPFPATPEKELLDVVDKADLVILLLSRTSTNRFEIFEGSICVNQALPKLTMRLAKDFTLIQKGQAPTLAGSGSQLTLGIFLRKR